MGSPALQIGTDVGDDGGMAVGVRLVAVVFVMAFAVAQPAPTAPTWTLIVADSLERFDAVQQHEAPHAYAAAWHAEGLSNGWHTNEANGRYRALRDRLSAVGYGLGFSFDAFSDGTVNAADTIYPVTIAAHIGSPMLAAYNAGAVERDEVQQLVDMAADFPVVDGCVPYSLSPNDLDAGCVHNVNALVGSFLARAEAAGLDVPDGMVAAISARNTASHTADGWHYIGEAGRLNDPTHAGAQALATVDLDRELGMMEVERSWREGDTLARMVVGPLVCGDDTDLRRSAAREARGDDPRRVAQVAEAAALMTENCATQPTK